MPSRPVVLNLASCSSAHICCALSASRTQLSGHVTSSLRHVIWFVLMFRGLFRANVLAHGKLIVRQLRAVLRQASVSSTGSRASKMGHQSSSRSLLAPSNPPLAIPLARQLKPPTPTVFPMTLPPARPTPVAALAETTHGSAPVDHTRVGRLETLCATCNACFFSSSNLTIFEGTIAEAAERVANLATQSHMAVLLSKGARSHLAYIFFCLSRSRMAICRPA